MPRTVEEPRPLSADVLPEDDTLAPARARGPWRGLPPWIIPSLVGGAVGLVLSIALPFDFFDRRETVFFVLTTALVAFGFLAGLFLLERRLGGPLGDGLITALVPYLAWPFLLRMVLVQTGVHAPLWIMYGTLLEFAFLALGLGIFILLAVRDPLGQGRQQGSLAAGVVGGAGAVALLSGAISTSPDLTGEGLFLFGLTAAIVAACLGLQWGLVRWGPLRNHGWLASGPALAVAGTQLFDGVVTYLAVVDPLGLAPSAFQENILLSHFILTTTKVGYPILKWALAIMIAYALDAREHEPRTSTISRLAVYLTLVVVGMGPALFSGTQLL